MSIRIVNLRTYRENDNELLFKVDRSSPVGNPYYMHNESERNEVCDMYEFYFRTAMQNDNKFKAYVSAIFEAYMSEIPVVLGCWCAPKRCHAETIVKYCKGEL